MKKIINEMRKQVLGDEEIKAFCDKYEISGELFERNLSILYQHYQDMAVCRKCLGKLVCQLDPFEHQSSLVYKNSSVERRYIRCPFLDRYIPENLDILFFPSSIDTGDLLATENRKEVFRLIKEYNKKPLSAKGIYLYGKFGTGKTFILLKIAQELTKKDIKVVFAYYPDLVRHIKSAIGLGTVEQIVRKLKNAAVLILDDVGGETNTPYIRDEVLGPVLEYRSYNLKPIFMSSNRNIEDLKTHFSETKDGINDINSSRIIERMKYMMHIVELDDVNFRSGLDKKK